MSAKKKERVRWKEKESEAKYEEINCEKSFRKAEEGRKNISPFLRAVHMYDKNAQQPPTTAGKLPSFPQPHDKKLSFSVSKKEEKIV